QPPGSSIMSPSVIAPPNTGNVFDTSKLGTVMPPGVSTERPPVKYPTDRANTSMLDNIVRRFREVYTPNALRGLTTDPRAAGWSDLSQLKDAMANESPDGESAFRRMMMFMGPTSSGTQVPTNLRHASYFSYLDRNGLLDPDQLRNGTLELPQG